MWALTTSIGGALTDFAVRRLAAPIQRLIQCLRPRCNLVWFSGADWRRIKRMLSRLAEDMK